MQIEKQKINAHFKKKKITEKIDFIVLVVYEFNSLLDLWTGPKWRNKITKVLLNRMDALIEMKALNY